MNNNPRRSGPRKNIVLFLVDTLRYDGINALQGTGGTLDELGVRSILETPNMDWLVENGTRIPKLHSPYGSTPPASSSLLTGLYPREHGCYGYYRPLDPEVKTLPEYFADEGYHTMLLNGHLFFDRMGIEKRFDEVTDGSIEHMISRMKELNSQGERVFVYVHTMDVHPPFLLSDFPPHEEYHDEAIEFANRLCRDVGVDKEFTRADAHVTSEENGRKKIKSGFNAPLWQFLRENVHKHFRKDEELFDDPVGLLCQLYTVGINLFDQHQVSSLVDYLRHDPDPDTTVLLTADHGSAVREIEGGMTTFRHQGKPIEELIRVPGVIYPEPDKAKTIRSYDVTSLTDLAPTLLSLEHVDYNENVFSGRNLLKDPSSDDRRIYAEFSQRFSDFTESDNPVRDGIFPLPGILDWNCVITGDGHKFYKHGLEFTEDDLDKPLEMFLRVAFSKIVRTWIVDDALESLKEDFEENDTREDRLEFIRDLRKRRAELDVDYNKELYRWAEDRFEEDNVLSEVDAAIVKELDDLLQNRFPDSVEVHFQITTEAVEKKKDEEEIVQGLKGLGYI